MMTQTDNGLAAARFGALIEIMQRLRTPVTGCPWDLEQTFLSIAPYTIEEAYEVLDAIQRGNRSDLCDELGDLLLQVVFHAQIAADEGTFRISDVVAAINDKMVRRHPHVFGDAAVRLTAAQQTESWEATKARERAALNGGSDKGAASDASALAGIAVALPALKRAEKLQKRAARTGFDWTDPVHIFAKLDEETEEVKEAMASGDRDAIEDEIGDMLFVCANLARRLSIDPEAALRRANDKFESRFRSMERLAANEGDAFETLDPAAQDGLWRRVKQA